jgi:Icc-related predicted phosphoesterase
MLTMKIVYASDLHFEINGLGKAGANWEPGDVLVLAGDIITAFTMAPQRNDAWSRSVKKGWEHMVQHVFPWYQHVFLLMGNHDHYKNVYSATEPFYREELLKGISNLRLLENNSVLVEDVLFLGCTLWTDFEKHNPSAMMMAQMGMNDYRIIYDDKGHPIDAEFTYNLHTNSVAWLTKELEVNKDKTTVVLTHHCPSFKSIGKRHRGSQLNAAYASDLTQLVLDNPQIKYWIHGHTHDSMKYEIGNTWVISNQCGYHMDFGYQHFSPHGENSYVVI